LAHACGDDAELQREVAELPGAHAEQGMLDNTRRLFSGEQNPHRCSVRPDADDCSFMRQAGGFGVPEKPT
jgi:hypothetical protein